MKLVYLIIGSEYDERTLRLISHLDDNEITFVLHRQITKAPSFFVSLENKKNVYLISGSNTEAAGSFGKVERILDGLSYIRKHIPQAERVVLLNHEQYAIRKGISINNFFCSDSESIFMEHFRIPTAKWPQGGKKRFPNFERIDPELPFYGGSESWSITKKAMDLMLDILQENDSLKKYFRHVEEPNVSFFQTILLNSDLEIASGNLVNDNLTLIVNTGNVDTKITGPFSNFSTKAMFAKLDTSSKNAVARSFKSLVSSVINLGQFILRLEGDQHTNALSDHYEMTTLFLHESTISPSSHGNSKHSVSESNKWYLSSDILEIFQNHLTALIIINIPSNETKFGLLKNISHFNRLKVPIIFNASDGFIEKHTIDIFCEKTGYTAKSYYDSDHHFTYCSPKFSNEPAKFNVFK